MSEKIVQCLRAAWYVTLIVLAILTYRQVVNLTNRAQLGVTAARVELSNSLAAVVKHNQEKVDGTLQNVNAILLQTGLAADQARRVSQEQHDFLLRLDKQVLAAVPVAQGQIVRVSDDLHGVVQSLQTSLAPVPALLTSLRETVDKTGKLADNPDIPRALTALADATENANKTLAHVDGVATHLEAMSADADKSLHHTLNPTKKSLIFGAAWSIVKVAAGLAPLARR